MNVFPFDGLSSQCLSQASQCEGRYIILEEEGQWDCHLC